ncbi:MAG: hypothetical protein M3N23_03340 [Pseudomonadota bacterium]|nr:hypothetical protein [Pseudomonadota bacterium]
MYLVAIAWIYVVLLMAMAEQSFVAGVMTLLLYCALPLGVILYIMATPARRRRAAQRAQAAAPVLAPAESESVSDSSVEPDH